VYGKLRASPEENKRLGRKRRYDYCRIEVGELTHEKFGKFNLSLSVPVNEPIVTHESGRSFCLSWVDIAEMAIERGICDEKAVTDA
jgi:hypothetical protein